MRQIPNVLGCSPRCEAAWGSDEFKRPQYSTRSALEAPGGLASPKGGGSGEGHVSQALVDGAQRLSLPRGGADYSDKMKLIVREGDRRYIIWDMVQKIIGCHLSEV